MHGQEDNAIHTVSMALLFSRLAFRGGFYTWREVESYYGDTMPCRPGHNANTPGLNKAYFIVKQYLRPWGITCFPESRQDGRNMDLATYSFHVWEPDEDRRVSQSSFKDTYMEILWRAEQAGGVLHRDECPTKGRWTLSEMLERLSLARSGRYPHNFIDARVEGDMVIVSGPRIWIPGRMAYDLDGVGGESEDSMERGGEASGDAPLVFHRA